MITTLDTQSWAKELVTGNAQFTEVFPTAAATGVGYFMLTSVASASGGSTTYTGVISGGAGNAYAGTSFSVQGFSNGVNNGTYTASASTDTTLTLDNPNGQAQVPLGTIFVVSNVRADNSYAILQSQNVPPSPGPGATFSTVGTYTFPQANSAFDPVVVYDPISLPGTPYLHIVGTRTNPTNSHLADLIKFTFNINTQILTGPFVLTSASTVRQGYDMVLLANGHRFIAVSVVDATMQGAELPPLFQAPITSVQITGGPSQPLLTITANNTFTSGQIVTLTGLTNATFLNGVTVQVITASATQFTAATSFSNYSALGDTGLATPVYSGENLLAFELDTNDNYVTGTLQIIASSPDRSGNTFSSVSLVTPVDTTNTFGDGKNIEVYFQSHPKLFTFQDQLFTISVMNRQLVAGITATSSTTNLVTVQAVNNFTAGLNVTFEGLTFATWLNGQTLPVIASQGTAFTVSFNHADYVNTADTGTATLPAPNWDTAPTNLYTFTGRYTDNRLTVTPDTSGNRYAIQNFWTQGNHPEGITGNVLLGTLQVGNPWFFHTNFGNPTSGSFIQAVLSVAQDDTVTMAYLAQPFNQVVPLPATGTLPAWPLQIATVNPSTLTLTPVAGFYNSQLFTWLRGTKSLTDDMSVWEIVGERSSITTVAAEAHTIPATGIIQVTHFAAYWENVSVTFTLNSVPLVEVQSNPAQGQYAVEPSDGSYVFNLADAGSPIAISYSYVSSVTPVYASLFNVPPIAQLVPNSATTVYRGQPLTLSAAGSTDADNDPIEYVWSENYPQPAYLQWNSSTTYAIGDIVDVLGVSFISLLGSNLNNPPITSPTYWQISVGDDAVTLNAVGSAAQLNVSPTIGGQATTFYVGVAAIDLFPDDVTPRHPALNVTQIQVTGTTVIFTVNNTPSGEPILPLAQGEQLMAYNIALTPPVTPTLSTYSSPSAVANTYYFVITYLNAVGETTESGEATIVCASGQLPQVTSPAASGDAVSYNVYSAFASGAEELQTPTPIAIGTNWPVPIQGLISGVTPPTVNEAYQAFLNLNPIMIVLGSPSPTPTTFAATVTPPSGYTSSAVSVVGFAIPQFQYQTVQINVPFNNPPTITFPTPAWLGSFVLTAAAQNSGGTTIYTGTITGGAANAYVGFTFIVTDFTNPFNNGEFVCSGSSATTLTLSNPNGQLQTGQTASALSNTSTVTAARNTNITITPGTITHPSTQFPVVYTGISDVDDVVTYTWSQVSGTPVTIIGTNGLSQPSLTFSTAGTNIDGEDLTFQLILSDNVNPPVTAQCTIPVAAYQTVTPDTHQLSRSLWSGNISQRNTAGTWGPLDISILYNDLFSVKRNSVNDGTDRYIVISPSSVLVYGGISPSMVLLRKLFTPNGTAIQDAVHTEADYTLVIDNNGSLFRYTTAPLINTDDPDTTIVLSSITQFTFNKIFCTYSYANQRIILLGGPQGFLLLQVNSTTLAIVGFLEISVEDNLLYGADNVQFFRVSDVETLRTGQVLVGTVLNASATVTAASVINNQVTLVAQNNFNVGDQITFTGFPAPFVFLNNRTIEAIATTATSFSITYQTINQGAFLTLSSVAASVGPTAVYTGTISGGAGNAFAGYYATVTGFTNGTNNGTYPVVASSNTTLTLQNAGAVAETDPAEALLNLATTGSAVSQNDGNTYETLIDLSHGQIIGTFDKSKLINQFVNSGEILFSPQSEYSGAPLAPVQNTPIAVVGLNGTTVTISWTQFRPDLVTSYIVNYSLDGINYQPLQNVGSGTIQQISVQLAAGQEYWFTIQALSLDGPSPLSNAESISI